MKHQHHDLIITWAADTSRVVQCRRQEGAAWEDCDDEPRWCPEYEYRLKPEPRPDVVTECMVTRCYGSIIWNPETNVVSGANLRLTFDGETGEVKGAVLL